MHLIVKTQMPTGFVDLLMCMAGTIVSGCAAGVNMAQNRPRIDSDGFVWRKRLD